MKKILTLVATLILGGLSGGCMSIASSTIAALPKVGVQIGPATALGFNPNEGAYAMITNPFPENALVIVYHKGLGILSSNSTVSLMKSWEPLTNQQIDVPVVLLFLRQDGTPKAVARRIFHTWNGNYRSQVESWIVSPGELEPVSDTFLPIYVDAPPAGGMYGAQFPREWLSGTLRWQLINASPYHITIRHPEGQLVQPYSQVGIWDLRIPSGIIRRDNRMVFVVMISDPISGRVVHRENVESWIPNEGVRAEQWLVTRDGRLRRW